MHVFPIKLNISRSIGRVFRSTGAISTEKAKNVAAEYRIHLTKDGEFKLTLGLS